MLLLAPVLMAAELLPTVLSALDRPLVGTPRARCSVPLEMSSLTAIRDCRMWTAVAIPNLPLKMAVALGIPMALVAPHMALVGPA